MIHRQYRDEKPCKGEITVFLALVSSIFLGFVVALASSARLQLIRMNIEGVMDAGLRSCFGEYDRELYKRYDLIYVDSSYRGGSQAGIDSLITHLIQYMIENTDYTDTDASVDWYRETVNDANPVSFVTASDEDGIPLKRQAVEYIEKYGIKKYTGAVNSGKGQLQGIAKVEFFSEWDDILARIESYGIPLTNPGKIVRGMVLGEEEFLTGAPLKGMAGDQPSKRGLKTGVGRSKIKRKSESDDAFIEFLMQKCGCYTEYYDKQALTAELEYIVYGMDTDMDNMKSTIKYLMDIRLSDNLRCIKGDGGKVARAEEKAYEVVMYNALIIPDPALIRLVRDSIIYAWAYAESAIDVSRLLNKGRCLIIKGSSDIELSLDELLNFKSKLKGSGGSGYSYKEITGMMVALKDDRTRRLRCMDVIEANERSFVNSGFRIDGCFEYLKAGVSLSSAFGYEHTIEREYMYE